MVILKIYYFQKCKKTDFDNSTDIVLFVNLLSMFHNMVDILRVLYLDYSWSLLTNAILNQSIIELSVIA